MIRAFALAPLLTIAACAQTDPLYQGDHWNAYGANARNLRAQVETPSDLVHGRGETYSDADLAVAAVARLRSDKVKKLQNASLSEVGNNSSGGGQE